MDGIVLNYDPKSGTGIVRTQDGKMFPFEKADWRGSLALRRNDRVEFDAEGAIARNIRFPQGQEPAGAALRKVAAYLDYGFAAGAFTIVFLLIAVPVAILNVGLSVVEIDESELVLSFISFVILDLLTAAAWIWGTSYKKMRTTATVFAVAATGLAVFILVKHALEGAS